MNGYKNYETWNVLQHILGNEKLYNLAKGCDDYETFASLMYDKGCYTTSDHVAWKLPCLDREEIEESFSEI